MPICMPFASQNCAASHRVTRATEWYSGRMSLFSTPGKRTERLPTLRVTPSERQAIAWLVEKLSREHGTSYGVSDIMRIALSRLYETERAKTESSNSPLF